MDDNENTNVVEVVETVTTTSKKIDIWFIFGLLTVIYTAAGMDLQTLTTWPLFIAAIVDMIMNPAIVVMVVYQIALFLNNPNTAGLDLINSIKQIGK